MPEGKQHTIAGIRRVILNEIEGEAGRHEWIVWVILFGSHARGTYIDNPINGYISDYDILVAVNGRELADDLELWYGIEDKIDRLTHSPINLIVHTMRKLPNGYKRVTISLAIFAKKEFTFIPANPIKAYQSLSI